MAEVASSFRSSAFGAAIESASVDVCVCTYRRPQIVQTLASIAAQQQLAGWRVKVIVADNDVGAHARPRIEAAAASLGLSLCYVHAPAHNISVARNACLAAARGDWLAFVDDDEIADPLSGLSALLRVAGEGGWDAVLGPVDAIYGDDVAPWIRQGDFHSIRPVAVRGEILTGYSCNALVRRRSIGPLWFDPAYGRSGGEDLDFFYRFTDRGGRIGYAPDALVREPVPAERASFAWLLRRRYRSGQSHGARLAQVRPTLGGRLAAALIAAAKAGVCAGLLLATLPWGVRRRRYALSAALHAGVVGRLLGARLVQLYGASAAPAGIATAER